MTERPFVPAEDGRLAGVSGRARHRRETGRQLRSRRHPPGRAAAAVLSLVLGVTAAMLLTWWDGGTAVDVGAPASVASLSGADARAPVSRAGRGEPRAVPAPAGGSSAAGPGASGGQPPPALPARTLVPAPPRSTAGPPTTSTDVSTGTAAVSAEVVRLTNVERAKVGCVALRVDPRLAAAAQGHSEDMADRDYFSHTTPAGESPWDRAKAAGYADPSAENIAMGYRTAAAVVAGWMGSPGHRANIQNCASRAVGIGYDTRGYYWTQLFGYV
jgi:uncharacterized protein YkwD